MSKWNKAQKRDIAARKQAEKVAEREGILAELDYLRYFYEHADFGPAHEDVVDIINQGYDKKVPDGYRLNEEDEE